MHRAMEEACNVMQDMSNLKAFKGICMRSSHCYGGVSSPWRWEHFCVRSSYALNVEWQFKLGVHFKDIGQ